MNVKVSHLNRFLSLLVCLFFSSLVAAQSFDLEGFDEAVVSRAAEGIDLTLVTNNQGDVVGIRIVQCEDCQHTTFLPARGLEIYVSEQQVSAKQAVQANGGLGEILYHPQTKLAQKVYFYSR